MIFRLRRSVGICASQSLTKVDRWILGSPARAPVILAILIATYFVGWSAVSFLRHYHFHSGYDLAIMDQVVWNTSQGRLLARSIEKGVTNDLGDHVRPHLAALSLLYLFIPSPYVLLTYQSLVLALSALPLYLLARRKFNSPAIGLLAAFCLLAYPPLGFLNRYDFHSEVLSIPLLIFAYERIDAGDLKSASLFMALTLFTKENLGVTIAALGIMAVLYYKHWRFGLTWALVGVAYSAVTLLVVIPAFRGEASDTLTRYHWLGNTPSEMIWAMMTQPGMVLQKIFAVKHIITMIQLIAPLAFLPLLGLPALIPALPTLVYNFFGGVVVTSDDIYPLHGSSDTIHCHFCSYWSAPPCDKLPERGVAKADALRCGTSEPGYRSWCKRNATGHCDELDIRESDHGQCLFVMGEWKCSKASAKRHKSGGTHDLAEPSGHP